jgi:hypothetical protein
MNGNGASCLPFSPASSGGSQCCGGNPNGGNSCPIGNGPSGCGDPCNNFICVNGQQGGLPMPGPCVAYTPGAGNYGTVRCV